MGAHNFHTQQYGSSPHEAYRDAVSDALFEDGHNPYNGTISTTSGCAEFPLLVNETINEWAQRVIDDPRVQKWEDCAYVMDPDTPPENNRFLWHFAGWAAC